MGEKFRNIIHLLIYAKNFVGIFVKIWEKFLNKSLNKSWENSSVVFKKNLKEITKSEKFF